MYCNECGYTIEEPETEVIMKNVNRYQLSGFYTLRMTRRKKLSGKEHSESVPLFHAFNVGACSGCGEPFTFVKENDDTHMVIQQPKLQS